MAWPRVVQPAQICQRRLVDNRVGIRLLCRNVWVVFWPEDQEQVHQFCEHKEREDNDESYIHKELDDVYEIYNKIRYEDDAIDLDEAYNEYEKNKEVSQEGKWIFV